jgi:hypothetical protein
MKTLLATTALVLCTLGTATAQAAGIEFAPALLMFDPTPVAEWDQRPDSEAAPTTITLTQSRQWYWAHYRATHPLTTTVAQVQAYEQREAAPIGLVGTPYPPGIEQQPGGIGSDYVAQAKADRAAAQQANTAAIKEDALAAKDAAVLSAHAEAKPKRTRTHKH